jgi:ribonuclease BN (tRNA processing enzyme)
VQILYKDHLILVDTGFGCCNLGEELMQRIIVNREELKVHIFFTHFHWDHIQGLPFFLPIHITTTTMNLYSPVPKKDLLSNLDILFDGSYSPFEGLMAMPSDVRIKQQEKTIDLDGLKIDYHPVDHGDSSEDELPTHKTYAYRFTAPEGESVCIVTDHEARKTPLNEKVIAFAKDCDTLIHDAQYTEKEYESHVGWGHSTPNQALENAIKMNAAFTLLTHHEPSRTDREIMNMHRMLSQEKKFKKLAFEFAREGIIFDVEKRKKVPKAG